MSDSDDDANIPSKAVCEKRCSEFVEVTGTDSALAMFYLQDRSWDLQRALHDYFEDSGGTATGGASCGDENSAVDKRATSVKQPDEVEDPEPQRIRVMSWNIDGLDQNSLALRTKGVCQVIRQEKPDVVFLQEVVQATEALLEKHCTDYMLVPGRRYEADEYYTAVMLKMSTAQYQSRQIVPFTSSLMMRNLLMVKAKVKGVPFKLLTTHLESTKDHANERKNQLQICFRELSKSAPEETVVFGGDLNLRDKELADVGGIPEKTFDLWESTGRRPEAQYTWDMTRNDNLSNWPKFKPRCRFDRLYVRQTKSNVKAVYFELVGLERLKSCGRFPSDHWGLLTHLDKV